MDYFCFEKINHLATPHRIEVDLPQLTIDIGQNLIRYRQATGQTQKKMAAAFAVSLAQYRKYEKGEESVKMHSVARWSIITGAPNNLLLMNTELSPYLKFADICWQSAPLFYVAAHASAVVYQSLLVLASEMTGVTLSEDLAVEDAPDVSHILHEMQHNYYLNVSKNMKLMRSFSEKSQEYFAELFDISVSRYAQYEKYQNSPQIPFTFFAKYHSILQIDSQWGTTGESTFSVFNRIRNERLNHLFKIMQPANPAQKTMIYDVFNTISKGLLETQLVKV